MKQILILGGNMNMIGGNMIGNWGYFGYWNFLKYPLCNFVNWFDSIGLSRDYKIMKRFL